MYTKSVIQKYSYEKYTELRDSKNMRDSDVAKATNIYPSTFTDWKNSVSMPGAEKLNRLAKLFDISIEDFLPNEGEL